MSKGSNRTYPGQENHIRQLHTESAPSLDGIARYSNTHIEEAETFHDSNTCGGRRMRRNTWRGGDCLVSCLLMNLDPEPVLSPPTPTRCRDHPQAVGKAKIIMTPTSPRQAPSRRTRTQRHCPHLSYLLRRALVRLCYLPKVFVHYNTPYDPADFVYLPRRVSVTSALRSC